MSTTVFSKDIAHKKIHVSREFMAELGDVWNAWTNPEVLDLWWAPLPWRTQTKSMDLRNGGAWFYSMNGPSGEQHWCKVTYGNIEPQRSYEGRDSFTDEKGVIKTDVASMHWKTSFKPSGNGTTVEVELTFASQQDLEQIVGRGFEEGFTAAHDNLDKYFQTR